MSQKWVLLGTRSSNYVVTLQGDGTFDHYPKVALSSLHSRMGRWLAVQKQRQILEDIHSTLMARGSPPGRWQRSGGYLRVGLA